MEGSIIQWNCRGLKKKLEEIQLLIKELNPVAFCIQETMLKDDDPFSVKNYAIYKYTPPIAKWQSKWRGLYSSKE